VSFSWDDVEGGKWDSDRQSLNIKGDIRFRDALMPNNDAGTAGKVLTSAGPGEPPTWETPAAGGGDVTNPLVDTDLLVQSTEGAPGDSVIFQLDGLQGEDSETRLNPRFGIGYISIGGIRAPELAFTYDDDGSGVDGLGPATEKRIVLALERTGTMAVVGDDNRRSHYEAFMHGESPSRAGAWKPVLRWNSFPVCQTEYGPGSILAEPGDVTRSGTTVTVAFGGGYTHKFAVGAPLFMTGNTSDGWTKSEGELTVATVSPDGLSFTYEDTGATATSNAYDIIYSCETDCYVQRAGPKKLWLNASGDPLISHAAHSLEITESKVTIPAGIELEVLGTTSGISAGHDEVTLGTAYGLSLSGQQLSVDPVQMWNLGGASSYGDTSGTPGDATSNTYFGKAAINTGQTACKITCNKLVTGSQVFFNMLTDWGTGRVWVTRPDSGSFQVNVPSAAGGPLYFNWHIH